MKIFLCWSQARSLKLADAMKELLVGLIPGLTRRDVFLSPEITKGSEWFTEIRRRLAESDAAVICLTPENVKSHWMHFEAGAVLGRLSKENVFPYLFGLRPEEVQGPLGNFQTTTTDEGDTRQLTEKLCGLAGAKFPADDYDARWKEFRGRLEEIKVEHISEVFPVFRRMFQRKTFDEELKECTNQTWVDRYMGARETQKALEGQQEIVRRVCQPQQAELFGRLVSTIDGYAGLMKGLLIQERQFAYTEAGEVDFTRTQDGRPHPVGESISPAVERRLKQIKQLVQQLDRPEAGGAGG